MNTVSLAELEQNTAGLLDRMAAGEQLLVVRDSRAVAELRPIAGSLPGVRPFGLAAGAFVVPDDFDAPLPEHVLREFHDTRAGCTDLRGRADELGPRESS